MKSVLPAIRAKIAKKLIDMHKLKQNQVAEILGVSQSAVSKYTRRVRGHVIEIEGLEEIQPLLERMLILLVEKPSEKTEFLKLFCKTCMLIRQKGLMCRLCWSSQPGVQVEDCRFCRNIVYPTE